MASLIDLFLVYQFITRLITPFNQWEAFKRGIIDEKGKVLRKRNSLSTPDDRRAWGYFDILAANLKKLLAKFPGGESRLVSFAAAGLLLREQKTIEQMSEEELEILAESIVRKVSEEGPANVVGGGAIAGLGVGSQGEPPGKARLFKKPLTRKRKVE